MLMLSLSLCLCSPARVCFPRADTCQKFLLDFNYEDEETGEPVYKYAEMLQQIANRELEKLEISLEDLADVSFCLLVHAMPVDVACEGGWADGWVGRYPPMAA